MTIGGIHTIAELSDLLAAKDTEIPSLEKNYVAFHPTWTLTDPTSDTKFKQDLDDLKARYGRATFALHTVINAVPSYLENVTPAESAYQIVLDSLQKRSGVNSPGDLQELWNRLDAARQAYAKANGQPPVPMYEHPVAQPRRDSDAEENFLRNTKWMDPTTKEGKKTFGWLFGLIGAALIGFGYMKSRPSIVVVAAPAPRSEPRPRPIGRVRA